MHSKYSFKCIAGSGDNKVYGFWHDGQPGRIEVRYGLPDREKVRDKDYYDRVTVREVNRIHRFWHPTLPFTTEFVDAFNTWEQGDHLEQIAQIQANPGMYGSWAEMEHEYPPPVRVRGVVWTDDGYEELAA